MEAGPRDAPLQSRVVGGAKLGRRGLELLLSLSGWRGRSSGGGASRCITTRPSRKEAERPQLLVEEGGRGGAPEVVPGGAPKVNQGLRRRFPERLSVQSEPLLGLREAS